MKPTYTLRYVPDTIGVFHENKFYPNMPITGVVSHPPNTHDHSPIRNEWTAVEIKTQIGKSRWHGVPNSEQAFIDSTLRFVVACNNRDEVLSKWELYKGGE